MNAAQVFNITLIAWLILSPVIFISLFFIVAPYGRHVRGGWGLALDSKLGWIIMEAFSPLIFMFCFITGTAPLSATSVVFLLLWEAHYLHRAFIYPFSLRNSNAKMSLSVILLGILFNLTNASLNGYYVFTLSGGYPNQWLADPRFIIGTAIFICGFIINRQSDYILRSLRQSSETGYRIPSGGLYGWVSCPNYFGEILIWVGWAIATWSLAGLSFALWTIANLAPRARTHSKWYRVEFPDYPAELKALIPGVW
jgi:3-oxo-5-alpha-steroid 4-dehydrogenase 1